MLKQGGYVKANRFEKNAHKWLIEQGLARATDIITIFPDIYLTTTKEFYEVKSLQQTKYMKKPRANFSVEQGIYFKKLNPNVLIFHQNNPTQPLWQGKYLEMLAATDLPFTIYVYESRHDKFMQNR